MIIVKKENFKDYEIVYGYRIKEETPDVFEYIQKAYSNNNLWGQEKVLTDVRSYRCSLHSLSHRLFCARESIEMLIQSNFDNYVLLEEVIKELPLYDKVTIALPQIESKNENEEVVYERGFKEGFSPLKVRVNEEDFSYLFEGFKEFDEVIVNQAEGVFNYTQIFAGKERLQIHEMLCEAIEKDKEEKLKQKEEEGV